MKWTVLVDNRSENDSLVTEHGLSVLFETDNFTILLDTGASDAFAINAEKMGVDLGDVDFVFISHGHRDHAGGLEHFIQLNKKAKVIIAPEAMNGQFLSRRNHLHSITTDWPDLSNRLLSSITRQQTTNTNPSAYRFKIDDNIFVIGHISLTHPTPKGNLNLLIEDSDGHVIQDTFRHELVLYANGFLFTGCAHCGLENILNVCPSPIHTVVGGFHLIEDYETDTELRDLAFRLKKNYPSVHFYTSHCTCDKAFAVLKEVLGEQIEPFCCGTTHFSPSR